MIRIADTYNAITHARGYRPPRTHEQAIEIMTKEARFFDPRLFDCFIRNVEEILDDD